MISAGRACNWEQGERVRLDHGAFGHGGRLNLVAAVTVRPGNTRRAIHSQESAACRWIVETDDSKSRLKDRFYRIGGMLFVKFAFFVDSTYPMGQHRQAHADVAEWQTR